MIQGLEEENVDKGHDDDREDDGIEPLVHRVFLFAFLISLFPEVPMDFFGDEDIEDDYQAEKPPEIAKPDYPCDVEQSPECELRPTIAGKFLQAHGVYFFLLTDLIIASNAFGLFMARSARTLRLRPMFCCARAPIN